MVSIECTNVYEYKKLEFQPVSTDFTKTSNSTNFHDILVFNLQQIVLERKCHSNEK